MTVYVKARDAMAKEHAKWNKQREELLKEFNRYTAETVKDTSDTYMAYSDAVDKHTEAVTILQDAQAEAQKSNKMKLGVNSIVDFSS